MTAACLSVRQLLGSTFSFQHLPLAQAAAECVAVANDV